MMRSLYSGVAGLRTHQTKMDVLGNNIANVNTTSFKSQSITFSDLMYQTTQTASGATATKGGVNARQIGLGAKSGAIATAIESQGATQTTNNPFDIMITGKSFFVVNNGKENLYTRDGSFYVDGAGNLAMQSNGYLVQGWVAQEDKETGEIRVNRNGGLSSLQIMSAGNSTYSPASTTQALYSGNIDDNDTNVTSDDGKTITLEFYDNKGYLYTGKFTLKDTGTDHLFSLQLTDIIDSDGNSINQTITTADGASTKRLDHVTFGDTQSTDATVNSAYEVVPGKTTSVINLLPGAKLYESVPAQGTLSDLMTTSRNKYAGILEKVYGITDAMVTSGTNGYSKTSEYTITEGVLTIIYDQPKGTYETTDYTYNGNNINNYYVQNNSGGLAYQAPATTKDAEFKSVVENSTYLKQTLTKVFGMTETDLQTYLSDANYRYSFELGNNGVDTFTVYRSTTLTTDTQAETSIGSLTGYAADFTEDSGYSDLTTELNAYGEDPIYYTLTENQELTVYGHKYDTTNLRDTLNTGVPVSGSAPAYFQSNAAPIKIDDLNADQKIELGNYLINAGKITNQSERDQFLADYSSVRVVSITGTIGVELYDQTPEVVIDTGNVIYKGKVFSQQYKSNYTNNYKLTKPDSIGGVLANSTAGTAYVLTGKEKTVSDLSEQMLRDVYGQTKSQMVGSYKISISSAGLSTYNTEKHTESTAEGVAGQVASDGTITYVTTDRRLAYDNPVPNTGNISDLLTTSTGEYKNLLRDVYGVTDEDADAFGSDGTYSINADGSISLTTGTHTIQLYFDAATGSLKTANGESNGLVKMVFDQDPMYGMEAFGYQKGTNDPDDVKPGQMVIDFSTVTNYNTQGASTIKAVKGDKKSLNTGRAVGEMNGVNISTDGQIFATYSNGQTKLLGQIASAEFANASGLSKEGDNLYASTLNSGEATIQDITTDGGYMNTGVLEMSNVDLSREFTEMITTQRGFQANSRIITVSDTLLEELTNLKR